MPLFGDWDRFKAMLRFAATGKASGIVEQDLDALSEAIKTRLIENIEGGKLRLRELRASTVERKGHDEQLKDTLEYLENLEINRKTKLFSVTFTIGPPDKKTSRGESFQSLSAKLEGGTVDMDPLPHFGPTFLEIQRMPEFKRMSSLKRLRAALP